MLTEALIFDMDGTMIDSMPWHARSWVEFARRHGIDMTADEILRRTTGRTGTECMHEVFPRTLGAEECLALVHEKEAIYRDLFDANFTEVSGFTAFASAAKPDADDAKPAAVGTVLRAFSSKTNPGAGRNKSRKARARRANELSAGRGFPFSQTASPAPVPRASSTCEPSGPSEIDRLPVTGRFSASSRLPQYFTSAMFAGA